MVGYVSNSDEVTRKAPVRNAAEAFGRDPARQ
jgi:hypothetical protein